MTDPRFTFDAELHAYAFDGKPVPGVTSVLLDSGLVDYSYCTEFALWRGSAIHRAIHLELTAGLDWASVPESFHPFISAALQYIEDHHATIVEVERRVFSQVYHYGGTLDLIMSEHGKCSLGDPLPEGHIRCAGVPKLVEIDWKSGPPRKATALQLAAYAAAYYEETQKLIQERRAVHLRANGEYQAHPYTNRSDRDRFLAALTVANMRREFGLIKEEAT